jgi:hypothetical protein
LSSNLGFCPQCGTAVAIPGQLFCATCGGKLTEKAGDAEGIAETSTPSRPRERSASRQTSPSAATPSTPTGTPEPTIEEAAAVRSASWAVGLAIGLAAGALLPWATVLGFSVSPLQVMGNYALFIIGPAGGAVIAGVAMVLSPARRVSRSLWAVLWLAFGAAVLVAGWFLVGLLGAGSQNSFGGILARTATFGVGFFVYGGAALAGLVLTTREWRSLPTGSGRGELDDLRRPERAHLADKPVVRIRGSNAGAQVLLARPAVGMPTTMARTRSGSAYRAAAATILALIALAIVAFATLSREANTAGAVSWTVQAIEPGGIDIATVSAGQRVKITASGTWCMGGSGATAECGGPGGIRAAGPGEAAPVLPSAMLGALIARVGSGQWVVVGVSGTITADSPGILSLAFNDLAGFYFDNSGSVSALVTIQE